MLVQVTREHIKHGESGDPWTCPIALALSAMGYARVGVGDTIDIQKSNGDPRVRYKLPLKAQQFIERFDSGQPVKPFAFILTERA